MAKKPPIDVRPEQVHVLPGRQLDVSSKERAAKRCKRYMSVIKFVLFCFVIFVLPVALGLVFGGTAGRSIAIVFAPIGVIASVICAYYSMKERTYTGRCGYEQPDENSNPYLGKLIGKRGFGRPLTLLTAVILIAASFAVVMYFIIRVRMPDIRGTDLGGGSRLVNIGDAAKPAVLGIGVIANVYFICYYIFIVLFYGIKDFFEQAKKIFLGYGIPFFGFQLIITVISALVYLLMTLLSDNAGASTVVESVATRVLDGAFDTTSISGFLAGDSSIVSSLTAVSLFVSFTDIIIDHIGETQVKQSRREQLIDLIFDKDNIRLVIVLILGLAYVGFSRYIRLAGVFGWIISAALFILWAFTSFRVFMSIQPLRYIATTVSFLGFDCMVPMPSVTDAGSAFLALLFFVIRTVGFLLIGMLIGYNFRFMKDMAVLEPDPEKRKAQETAADVSMGDFAAQARDEVREEEYGRQGTNHL